MKYRKYDEKIIIDPQDVVNTEYQHDDEYYGWAELKMPSDYTIKITARSFAYSQTPTPLWTYLSDKLGEKKAHQFLQTLNTLNDKGLL